MFSESPGIFGYVILLVFYFMACFCSWFTSIVRRIVGLRSVRVLGFYEAWIGARMYCFDYYSVSSLHG